MLPSIRRKWTLAMASCCALLVAGCSDSIIDTRQDAWTKRAITSYDYSFNWSCFCGPDLTAPVRISVTAGAITGVVNRSTSAPVAAAHWSDYRTIDGLFAFLHEAEARNAAEIRLTWDPAFDYPATAFIDYVKDAADDEKTFAASDLAPR